jgi:hypothetical protein
VVARRPPPAAGPESPGQQKRQRPEPTLVVRIVAKPSVLTARMYNKHAPQIVGDGVDFLIAGIELTVGPPGEWEVDASLPRHYGSGAPTAAVSPTWRIVAGRATAAFVNDSPALAGTGTATRTDDNNVVVRTAWHDRSDQVTLGVDVGVRVRSLDGAETRTVNASATSDAPIPVVGANPRLELSASVGGGAFAQAVTANADGMDTVRVEPLLELFEQVYAGGLALRSETITDRLTIDGAPNALRLSDFFQVLEDAPGPDQANVQAGLTLRCKFHLNDEQIQQLGARGAPVKFGVRPTGGALGLDAVRDRYDALLGEHYRKCAERYGGGGLPEAGPVHVALRPSVVDVSPPDPDTLPKSPSGADRYTTFLAATVRSASGAAVPGRVLEQDIGLGSLGQWHFRVWYDVPDELRDQPTDTPAPGTIA